MKKVSQYLLPLVSIVFCFSLRFLPGAAHAASPDKVWIPPHTLSDGTAVPGYWRPAGPPGHVWVEGHVDDEGNWIPGHWKPLGPFPRNKVWSPGFWEDGYWHEGRWVAVKPGKVWVAPHYSPRGRWIPGHWR